LGALPYLRQVAGAGEGVVVHKSQRPQLGLVALLLGIHDLLENDVLHQGRGDVFVQRQRVRGKFLPGPGARFDQLVVEVIDGLHGPYAEGYDRVAVLAGYRHHLLGAEGLAVHHQRLHDLGHCLALLAGQHRLLLRRERHAHTNSSSFCFSAPSQETRARAENAAKRQKDPAVRQSPLRVASAAALFCPGGSAADPRLCQNIINSY
jgi:hypothetical protein